MDISVYHLALDKEGEWCYIIRVKEISKIMRFLHIQFLSFSKTMTNCLSEMSSLLAPIASKINNENWDQYEGKYYIKNPIPCCFGAHISVGLGICIRQDPNDDLFYSFRDSITYLTDKFNLTEFQLKVIFYCAGSSEDPFGAAPWKYHPSIVLDNIKYIKTRPPDIRGNFYYFNYRNIKEVKEWLKIERKRIELCRERDSVIKNSKELVEVS